MRRNAETIIDRQRSRGAVTSASAARAIPAAPPISSRTAARKVSKPFSYAPVANCGTSVASRSWRTRIRQQAFETIADLHPRDPRVAEDEQHESGVFLPRADLPVARRLHRPG